MEVLLEESHRRMPWKNGGGETFEIAVSPVDAALDEMEWRISMAVVASSGPFSSFPGIDRTLSIVQGAGLLLTLEGMHDPVALTTETQPYAFPGDVAAAAQLVHGTVADLNVMTRRGRYRHIVRRIGLNSSATLASQAGALAIFCCEGAVTCTDGDAASALLQPRDCALFRTPPPRLLMLADAPAVLLVAEFYRTTE